MCVGSLFYRRTSLARANGTVTRYSYDNAARLSKLVQDLGGTANDLTLDFSYNPASQIVSNSRSNDAYAFTGHTSGTIGETPNGLNQLANRAGVSLTYDARGNLTHDGTRGYSYNSENRLVSVSNGAQFFYDPLGRLNGAGSRAGNPPAVHYESLGSEIVAERSPTNATQRRFVYGPGSDEPLVWYEGSGTTDRRFLQADERGSVIAVTDINGSPLAINTFDEYGNTATTSSTHMGRFLYTGQRYFSSLDLYYYKARMYNPKLGRHLYT
ncbi:MAG: hypothetical protein M3Q08_08485 [Pseudomonadota bacterium]|nr:hypothetical protein [Pseudomonadota bacterium]